MDRMVSETNAFKFPQIINENNLGKREIIFWALDTCI